MSDEELSIDANDPYYRKIKKLIMYRNSYKSIESELIEARSEIEKLNEILLDRNAIDEKDYNNLIMENENLRKKLEEMEENNENTEKSEKTKELEIKYEALTQSVNESKTETDLVKENEELQKENAELNEKINNLSNKFLELDEISSKLQKENEELRKEMMDAQKENEKIKKQINSKNNKLKKLKNSESEQNQRIVSLEVQTQEIEDLYKKISELNCELDSEKKSKENSVKLLNKENGHLRDEICAEKRKTLLAAKRYESAKEENEKLRTDNAKLIGKIDGMGRIKQSPAISFDSSDKKLLKSLEMDNEEVKSKLSKNLVLMNSMYSGLRTLLLKMFIDMPFNLNWEDSLKFLEKKLEDLKAISSDRDLLTKKLSKERKQIAALTEELKTVKKNSQVLVSNAQNLMDQANEKLEEQTLLKPYLAFQRSIMNRTSRFISRLVNSAANVCCTLDGISLDKSKLRSVIICSIAARRLSRKIKEPFEPQAILTYASQQSTDIVQRLNNCAEEIKDNQQFAVDSINELIYSEKNYRTVCNKQNNTIESNRLQIKEYERETRLLKTKVASMYPSKEIMKRDQKLSEMATCMTSLESENAYLKIELRKLTKEREIANRTTTELRQKLNSTILECDMIKRQYSLSQMQYNVRNQNPEKKKHRAKTLDAFKETRIEEFRKELSDMSESITSSSPARNV